MYVARPVPTEYWLSPPLGLRLFRGDYCALVKTGVMVFPSYVQEACEINDGISLSSNHAVAGIVFVVQRRQFRIMAYVQRSELIGVAEQSRQFRTAAHIQRDESIGVAGQHFQRLEIFDTFQRGQQAIAGESSVHAECPNVFHLSESDMLRVGDIALLLQYSGEPRIECGGYIRIVVGSCRYHYVQAADLPPAVAVIVAVPSATAVTVPLSPTVATASSLLLHVTT